MSEIKTPSFPESITEGEVASWLKQEGDSFEEGETLVEIETDKVTMEVPADQSGVLDKILKNEGDVVSSEEVIGLFKAQGESGAQASAPKQEETPAQATKAAVSQESTSAAAELSPSVRRLLKEHQIDAATVKGSGKDGRIVAEDIEAFVAKQASSKPEAKTASSQTDFSSDGREQQRVRMTRMRKTVAKRLLDVQHQNAILTTFNEVDMHQVMQLRADHKDAFMEKFGVKLGFMSFFVHAVVEALKAFPNVNASIDGDDIVYHGFFDISIAVSSPKGLVVPVVRDADQLSMAEVEKSIREYAIAAKEGTLKLEDMQGGTFTITNGGTFGSMLSTPIINPPQSGILGMHNIVKRPVVVDGEIVIRPIMYLALSYDHRIIDGKDSVSFLKMIKELLEDPSRMMLQI